MRNADVAVVQRSGVPAREVAKAAREAPADGAAGGDLAVLAAAILSPWGIHIETARLDSLCEINVCGIRHAKEASN